MICPNCQKENRNTNIRCEYCSFQLIDLDKYKHDDIIVVDTNENNELTEVKVSSKKIGCISNIILIIFVGPWLFIGIILFGVGIFANVNERIQSKGYDKTVANFNDYVNCNYEGNVELCEAVYEYKVNGVIYSVSPKKITNRENFNETDTVYYNPNNPSESLIYVGFNSIIVTGLIIIGVITIIFIIKGIILKKITKGQKEITVNTYKKKYP